MDYSKWIEKWKINSDIDISKRMSQHAIGITNSSIEYTPTFFINGKKIDNRYSLDDLKLLIPQLVEIIE